MVKRTKAGLVILVTLVVASLARGIGKDVARSAMGRTATPSAAVGSEAYMMQVASIANKSLPMTVGKDTELVSVVGADHLLVFNHRVINFQIDEIAADQITLRRPRLVNHVCTTPETRDGLLQRGITMRYRYADRNMVHITSIDVAPSDCGF